MARKGTCSAQGGGTIRKKTVTRSRKEYTYWEGRITVGRDPGTGKQLQRSFTGKTQKEVREKLQAVAVEISRGTYQAPNKITVSAWMEEWLATFCANKVKPLTLQSYAAIIKNHIVPALGAIELQAVRGTQIQKLYNSMTRAGPDHGKPTASAGKGQRRQILHCPQHKEREAPYRRASAHCPRIPSGRAGEAAGEPAESWAHLE